MSNDNGDQTATVGRPRLINSPEEFETKVEEYVAECEEEGRPMTIAGIALHLGFVSRQSFYDYEKQSAFSYIVKKARMMIERQWEEAMAKKNGQVAGPIFWLKNHAGYRDSTDVRMSGPDGGPIQTEDMTPDAIRRRFADRLSDTAKRLVTRASGSTAGNGAGSVSGGDTG